jgi:2-keto-4-pentenoate hydratase/2-oxohepta-3-ene-1,7-dioic acid hydratase in catechol pathway
MQINETWLEIPGFYFSNVAAVVGPFDPVPIAPGCEQFDFELEVAAVIGRAGSNLHPDEADDHIVGFTIFNDWSGRDLQIYEMQLGLGPTKGKDSANTLGPMLVTKDELEPFRRGNSYHLEMTAWVNDDEIGHGYMDQMDWSWGEMIAYASRGTRLLTGEVIGSGTVPTGCLFEHFAAGADDFRGFLKPGDIVTFEVEQLGRLRQLVTESLPVHRLSTGF